MLLLQPYLKGNMGQTDVQGSQEIGKTGFFAFLKDYWKDPEGFGVSHARRSSGEITLTAEAEIRRELPRKKKLIEDPRLLISGHNLARQAIPPYVTVF